MGNASGGSHKSREAANPFQQNFNYPPPPAVMGSGLSARMRSAVESSSSPSSLESGSPAVNSNVTARPL